ncbi:Minichromosome maintenance protein 10 [Wickerhamomyces ciferrii]|uniref:Minichromosome maintenance protein 10 n=1 Tax=Wickerhamomyces ciferrii (strain ATCC 14091 / BCRC 22168 / CBS 111 / JCM 3599 / NBRC 0793 / NRRL Y-1031 F-60-10) TaxID=1206466 RepID=K0KFC9_WICCF|nr:Minichromosome maintenance protein 10 [Wickerhamomyces ciferrii]CCH43820.1 Minichromosome maintenance protein 10 [Wickerhamomyces ciferrii]
MEDPRDIKSDDDELAKLTADEQDSVLKAIEKQKQELLEKHEAKRRKREAKQKQAAINEVQRSPSPVKSIRSNDQQHSIKPKNLNQDLLKANDPQSRSDASSEGTTSYFINSLNEHQNKVQDDREEARKLMASRIYTFDSDLACEPFTVDEKEYFSGKQISKRYLTHDALSRFLEDKKVLRIPKLFAKVCPPTFEEPRYPNWIIIGVLSKKSVPKGTSDKRSKFMTLTLTDFKMTVDIHMFGDSVEKYIKLRVGDIIAVLNPQIYIWKPDQQGIIRSFSLSIKHSYDCIMEIARARDFGTCQSLKKDGNVCGTPIDISIEDCCSFHKELRIRKTAGKRMELNGSFNMRSPTKNGRKQQFLMGGMDNKGNVKNSTIIEDRYAPKVDRQSKSMVYFSNPNAGKAFFDDSFQNPDILKNLEEKKRKRQEQKKERELKAKMMRLGEKPTVVKESMSQADKDLLLKKKALTGTAFPGQSVKAIGYDPTSKPHVKGILGSDELFDKNDESLNELLSITSKKTINLGLSKEERAKRAEQKAQATKMWKRLQEKERIRKENIGKIDLDSGSNSSDSDSDFEVKTDGKKDAYLKFKQSQNK